MDPSFNPIPRRAPRDRPFYPQEHHSPISPPLRHRYDRLFSYYPTLITSEQSLTAIYPK